MILSKEDRLKIIVLGYATFDSIKEIFPEDFNKIVNNAHEIDEELVVPIAFRFIKADFWKDTKIADHISEAYIKLIVRLKPTVAHYFFRVFMNLADLYQKEFLFKSETVTEFIEENKDWMREQILNSARSEEEKERELLKKRIEICQNEYLSWKKLRHSEDALALLVASSVKKI